MMFLHYKKETSYNRSYSTSSTPLIDFMIMDFNEMLTIAVNGDQTVRLIVTITFFIVFFAPKNDYIHFDRQLFRS